MSVLTRLSSTLNDPLLAARSRRAIGYLGWNVPVELILAADAVPVSLNALPLSSGTGRADRFLESSFSAQSRLVADRWLAGDFDCLEAVIFSRSDDNAQRLYYYLCELQRMGECQGPRPLLYDLARIQRQTSVEHTIESTRGLAAAIAVDESRLMAATERIDARQTLLGELVKLRMDDEVPLGSVVSEILRGGRADWSEEFDVSLREWLAAPTCITPRKRVLLVGSVPSDEHVHSVIEVDGTAVVGEINEAAAVLGRSDGAHSLSSDPVSLIGRRCYQQTNAVNTLLQSPEHIVRVARSLRVDGVIVWMLATDTGLAWQAPRMERALHEASVPTLMLTSQPQMLSAESLTRIAQFRCKLEVQ